MLFKIWLLGLSPMVWCRVHVPATFTLRQLHGVIQVAMSFLCADLRITATPRADHAQYLDNWLRVLKADKKAIFTVASKASQAAEFLAAFQDA